MDIFNEKRELFEQILFISAIGPNIDKDPISKQRIGNYKTVTEILRARVC